MSDILLMGKSVGINTTSNIIAGQDLLQARMGLTEAGYNAQSIVGAIALSRRFLSRDGA